MSYEYTKTGYWLFLQQAGLIGYLFSIVSLSKSQDDALIGHIYIYWKAAQSSVFPELSSERSSINLQGEETQGS